MGFILGIDQGTTGSTAVLMDERGRVRSKHTAPVPQHFPRPGWVEHDPTEILTSLRSAVTGALSRGNISAKKILGIGLTNQRETVSLFQDAKPLHRFIVWQDRRTSEDCRKLQRQGQLIRKKTGTPIDPYFSSTKIAWLKKHLKISGKDSRVRLRTIDSFLFRTFTGEDVIEATNAHRTQLVHLQKGVWDNKLLELFDIPKSFCPQIVRSEGLEFKTRGLSYLPDGIPIAACLGDQQAALFGQNCWKSGEGKITFGTGAFLLLHTGDTPIFSKESMVSTLALEDKNGRRHYALEGSAFTCGAWIQWLHEQLELMVDARASERLAKKVKDSNGVFVIPALAGMGAPFWKPHLRGSILGLTRGANRSHLIRASLESLAFQNRALVDAMAKDFKKRFKSWKVDGGVVKNDLLMQIQADVLNSEIIRPSNLEATASGAALLAARSLGVLTNKEIQKIWKVDRRFSPRKSASRELQKTYAQWHRLVDSAG